jgi:zinc transport system permease protein
MFLVGSMALGAILVHISREVAREGGRASVVQSWESILFGSNFLVGPDEAIVGWIISAAVLGVAWWVRRPLLFWVFDEESSPAFGVRAAAMKTTLMVLLAIAVVVAMRLAGVVLATALLVLPGATALRLTDRLWPALAFSVATGIVGLMAGLSLSLRFDWPPGPCVVLAMTVLFAIAAIGSSTYKTSSARAAPAGAPSP